MKSFFSSKRLAQEAATVKVMIRAYCRHLLDGRRKEPTAPAQR